jgi:hypothetical protein
MSKRDKNSQAKLTPDRAAAQRQRNSSNSDGIPQLSHRSQRGGSQSTVWMKISCLMGKQWMLVLLEQQQDLEKSLSRRKKRQTVSPALILAWKDTRNGRSMERIFATSVTSLMGWLQRRRPKREKANEDIKMHSFWSP